MSKARQLAQRTNQSGRKNLIINGAMNVAQRGTSVTGSTSGGYQTVDRFKANIVNAGTWTISQSTDAPDGFSNSLKFDCTTADTSLGGSDRFRLDYYIEGQDVQHLQKGSASAKSLTVSFYVKTNKTGTYVCELNDADNTRAYSQTYTVDSANTWEKKTIVFSGDTSGVLDNDNNSSLQIHWWIASGTDFTSGTTPTGWEARTNANRAAGLNVNIADSTSNDWQLTGVQLEVGSVATEFEHRSFGEELQLCKRYLQKIELNQYSSPMIMRGSNNGGASTLVNMLPVTMRDGFTSDYTDDVTAAYWSNIGNTSYSTETVKFYISSRSGGRGYAWGVSEASFVGNNELVATAMYSSSRWLYLDAEL